MTLAPSSSAARVACLLAGLLALAAAAALPSEPLAVQMAGHAVVVSLAAPLIVLGAPLALALEALPPAGARRLRAALRSRPVAILTAPAVALVLFVGAQIGFHLTPLYDLSLEAGWAHQLQHLVFLGTALLLWEVAIGASPLPHRIGGLEPALLLMLAMPASDLAGAWFMATGREAAGVVMIAGMIPLGLGAAVSAWRAARVEEREQGRGRPGVPARRAGAHV